MLIDNCKRRSKYDFLRICFERRCSNHVNSSELIELRVSKLFKVYTCYHSTA